MASDDGVSAEISGLEDVVKTLDALPEKLQRAAMRPALSAAGQVMMAAAEANAPEGPTGQLKAAEDYKVSTSLKDDAQVTVGPDYGGKGSQDPGVYGLFTEVGTKYQTGQHWMKRAYDESAGPAADAAIEVLKAVVDNLPS